MSTARKYSSRQRSMSTESRNKAYGKINIIWQKLRPDLKGESKEELRGQLLEWIVRELGLKKLDSIKDLTDGQIGSVIEALNALTTPKSEPVKKDIIQTRRDNVISVDFTQKKTVVVPPSETEETTFFSTEPQQVTLQKLSDYIWGEDTERRDNFLTKRKFSTNFKRLTIEKANSLTIILLNTAAHSDLKKKSKNGEKICRSATAKYIPVLKKKLGIKK